MAETTTHIGRKISRLRELRGMKQDALAELLGISQQSVSKIEQSVDVDDSTLDRIGKALNLSKEAIKKFDDEAIFQLIQHNVFHDSSSASTTNNNCIFNPLDEIRKLNADKEELFRALLKEKDEKIALLEKVIEKLEKK